MVDNRLVARPGQCVAECPPLAHSVSVPPTVPFERHRRGRVGRGRRGRSDGPQRGGGDSHHPRGGHRHGGQPAAGPATGSLCPHHGDHPISLAVHFISVTVFVDSVTVLVGSAT